MENNPPLVSIIIPVYNRSTELERALNSVLKQTTQDFEVIVVDDKSDNVDIASIVVKFEDARLKYVLNTKEKSNANVCRNIGIELAKGSFTDRKRI